MQKIQLVKQRKIVTLSVILVVLMVFTFLGITPLQEYYAKEKEDWRAAVQFLKANSRSKDVVIAEPAGLMPCLLYYYDNITNRGVISLRRYNNSTIHYYELSNNITIVSTGDLNTLEDISSKNDRVWVVSSVSYTPPEIRNWLHDNLTLMEEFPGRIQLYLKQPVSFDAVVFGHVEWNAQVPWEKILDQMGASVTTFNDTTFISDINFSEFDIVVFADFMRPLDDEERLHLKESVQNGVAVVISGLSPWALEAATDGGAGSTVPLTKISSWFGATTFSEASRADKWKVKFTENAIEIMKELDLESEYAFYTLRPNDWSTPTGCTVQPTSLVYAYRVNDGAATIFTHKFGKGVSIFIGPRFGFDSPDAETFKAFLKSLIRFYLGEK